jgi:predicted nucleic acid-binding Zn ribbon protein
MYTHKDDDSFCGSVCRAIYRAKERRTENRAAYHCEFCGEIFVPTRTDSRFCSNACRQRAYRERNSRRKTRRERKSR